MRFDPNYRDALVNLTRWPLQSDPDTQLSRVTLNNLDRYRLLTTVF